MPILCRCCAIVILWKSNFESMATRKYNKLKRALKQKKRTGKWLASELGVDESTVSRWCRNLQQPSIQTLFDIADLLDTDPAELLVRTKEEKG